MAMEMFAVFGWEVELNDAKGAAMLKVVNPFNRTVLEEMI